MFFACTAVPDFVLIVRKQSEKPPPARLASVGSEGTLHTEPDTGRRAQLYDYSLTDFPPEAEGTMELKSSRIWCHGYTPQHLRLVRDLNTEL